MTVDIAKTHSYVLREAPQEIFSVPIFDQRPQPPVLANKQAAAVFTIVLNVTFFYSFVIGGNKGVGRLREG